MNSKGYYALLLSGIVKKKRLSVELVRRDFLSDTQQDYAETQIVPWTAVAQTGPSGTELSVEDVGNQISISVDGQKVGTVFQVRAAPFSRIYLSNPAGHWQ